MDLKKTNAPVNTITYNKTVIEEPTGNVYEAITIMAKRANQINSEIKNKAVFLRRKHRTKLPDAIIIATALYLNLPLVTADSDFKKIDDIRLIYYQK